jgi:hypothetical protein
MRKDLALALEKRPTVLRIGWYGDPDPADAEVLGQLDFVRTLEITVSQGKRLPEAIARLTELTELAIDGAPLPLWLGALTRLRTLKLTSAPPENLDLLAALPSLSDLKLDQLKPPLLEVPPVVFTLTGLRFLEISSCGLRALPAEIARLTRLESLKLGFNALEALPPEIGTLPNLETLIVYRNELRTVPAELAALPKLRMLYASNNRIDSLPPELDALAGKSVSFDNNLLATAPPLPKLLTERGVFSSNPFTEKRIPMAPMRFLRRCERGPHEIAPAAADVFPSDVERCADVFLPVLGVELREVHPEWEGQAFFLFNAWNHKKPLALERHTDAAGRTRLVYGGPFEGFDAKGLGRIRLEHGHCESVVREPPADGAYVIATHQTSISSGGAWLAWRATIEKELHPGAHLGNPPLWTQNDETPTCPRCSQKMPFVGQLNADRFTDALPDTDLFLFVCPPCKLQVQIHQRT